MNLHLISVVTPELAPLRTIFEVSLRDDFPREIFDVESSGIGNGDYKSQGWMEAVIAKQRLVYESILRHRGDYLIVADIDIQFFGEIRGSLEPFLEPEPDMLFQAEHRFSKEVNAGFIVMRSNDLVQAAYEVLLKEDLRTFDVGEQSWFNQYLHRSPLRWGVLPETFYAWSQNPGHPPEGILLHHANCTSGGNSVQKKLDQMAIVRKIVESRSIREGSRE